MDGIKKSYHDFEPIKAKIRVIDLNGQEILTKGVHTVLCSPNLGQKIFCSYLAGFIQEAAMAVDLFVIKPTNSKDPFTRAQGPVKLHECGFTEDGQEICLVQLTGTSEQAGERLIRSMDSVARYFKLNYETYVHLL